MNQRIKFGVPAIWPVLALALVHGCGGDGTKCGDGTVAVDGTCVPDIGQCGPGTVSQGGTCVPACPQGQFWDGAACADVPACADGTVFDAVSGTCVPACGEDQYWDGNGCSDVPACGEGTSFDPDTGGCVPDAGACAPGTSLVDGECVATLACGEESHPEDGQCVPDQPPVPDVFESEDDTRQTPFDLPAAGESILLGGALDAPRDKNDDGYPDPDWDAFAFEAQANTWLRIRAVSEDATLPAFTVDYQELAEDGGLVWRRVALAPDSRDCQREVFLPYAGDYVLWVSDYNHVAAFIFQYSTVPVGGDDFTYQVSVENLGVPQPQAVALPHTDTGNVADGSLGFYAVSGPGARDFLELTARPVRPEGLDESDVYPALLLLGADGTLLGSYTSYATWESAALLHAVQSGQTVTVVRDFFTTVGPRPLVTFAARALTPTDCDVTNCSTVTVTDEQSLLLSWDLAAGDFFVAGSYFGPEDATMIHQRLLDDTLVPLSDQQMVYPGQHGAVWAYADRSMDIHLWMRWGDAEPAGELDTEVRVHPTGEVTPGNSYTGLPILEMPPGTLYPAGIQHFAGQGDQVVFFSSLTTQGGGWSNPIDMIMSPMLETMGPVIDVNAWNFPEGHVTPTFTYVKDDGHKLHYVYDGMGDPSGGTYGVTMEAYAPIALGRVDVDAPAERTLESPSGLKFYTFEAGRNQYVEITVDGVLASDILPEIWVMNFGEAIWDWIYYRWAADPDAPGMGLVVAETAPAQFEPFTAGYVSPYDGMSLLLIMDASGEAGPLDLYNLTLNVPPPPSNDLCADAEPVALSGGTAHIEGSNLTATDQVSELACTGGQSPGPEVFYSLALAGGDTVEIVMDSDEIGAALYLFTSCADIEGSCVAGSDSGTPERIEFQVPAGAGGTYIIGADANTRGGSFTLDVTVTSR